jgi:diacylglycerol kinase (ATP)
VKAFIIFNPHAGTRDVQIQIQEAGTYLQTQGWHITWCQTSYAGHATQFAREAAEQGEDVAIAAGGDGTINEVMNGLIESKTALGILPAGTGNVFATEMHIPIPGPLAHHALKKAAETLITGQTRRVDVARATFGDGVKRHFLLWAGVGLDAEISQAFETDKNHYPGWRTLGMIAWLLSSLFVLREFRGKRMSITVDQGVIDRRMILTTVSNSQLYGRFWRLSPEAKLDDGLLDVTAMEGYGWRSSIKLATLAMLGRHTKDPEVHIYRTKYIKIETKEPIPVHLDAENVGHTPIEIKVVPRALKVILPKNAPHYLFLNLESSAAP